MREAGIYRIVHIATGREYVGQAIDIARRWRDHRNRLDAGTHSSRYLQRCWHKHGSEAFAFDILELCDPDDLNSAEQAFIDDRSPAFNSAPIAGSSRERKWTKESRERQSLAKTGVRHTDQSKAKLSAAAKGRAISAEHRAKISAAKKGKGQPQTEESRMKISNTLKGRAFSPEHRAALSKARTEFWARRREAGKIMAMAS